MAGTEATANDLSRTGSRSLASITHATRWREKLKEKAGKLKGTLQPTAEEQESNVSDFLGKPSHARPIALGLQIPTNDALDPVSYAPVPTYHITPPKKSKGLTVTFTEKEPEIIGQGGDECEIPVQDVVGSWAGMTNQNAHRLMRRNSTELPKALSPGLSQDFLTADAFTNQRSSLQRVPTRKPVGGWEQKRLSMNMEEGLIQAQKGVGSENNVPNEVNISGHARSPPKSYTKEEQIEPTLPQSTPPMVVNSAHARELMSNTYHPPNDSGMNRTAANTGYGRQSSQDNRFRLHETVSLSTDKPANAYRQNLPIRSNHDISASQQIAANSFRHEKSIPGQIESDEFYSRVQHLRGVFRLAAEKTVDIESKALEHWLRMSSWWFLRGKTMLERIVGSLSQNGIQMESGAMGHKTHQSYVDLAKAWWSMEEVLPDLTGAHSKTSISNTLDKFDNLDYSHLLNTYNSLSKNMRDFAISMRHSNLMPPPAVLIQGADPCIWIPYPPITAGILSLTAFLDPRTLTSRIKRGFFPIIFDHTNRHAFLGRAFVEVDILSHKSSTEAGRLPCLLSIFRERSRSDVELTIISQDGQINTHVQHDPNAGPTWTNIKWQNRESSLLIDLSKDFQVSTRLGQDDFMLLQEICNQTQQIETEWHADKAEDILFDSVIPVFHVAGSSTDSSSFPSIPMKETSIRLFIRSTSVMNGAIRRSIFDGYRLAARNSLAHSTVSCFNVAFGKGTPVLWSNLRGENEAPALLLRLHPEQDKPPLILTFKSVEQRSHFHMLVSGILRFPNEVVSKDIPMLSMSVVEIFGEANQLPPVHSLGSYITWNSLKVVNERQSEGLENLISSQSMRVCSTSNCGSVVDFANLAAGELQISLEVTDIKSIKVFRPAQNNVIATFANNMVPKEEVRNLEGTLGLTTKLPTARLYKFPTLEALHIFQRLVTGFEVVYDGLATAFSISHRRSMIPVYKKQEASGARIQILTQDNRGQKTFHLLAVLSDFPNGKIMSFQLHGADIFEATFKSSKYCLRFIDAKFALPKSPDNTEMAWDFICLDAPEYPAEHDDVVIGFDTEQGKRDSTVRKVSLTCVERDDIARVLPAPIKTSRLQSLRR